MKTKMPLVSKFMSVLMVVIASFIFCDVYTTYGGPLDKITLKKPSGGSSVSKNDLDQLYFLVSGADKLLQKSLNTVLKMVANKDEIQEMERRLKEIENIKDPKEKESAMDKYVKDAESIIARAMEREETSRKIEALDAEQKKLFANAIFNIFLAGLMDREAVEKGQKLSQAIQSNPTYAVNFVNDIDRIKNIITTLPPQANKIFKLGNNLVKLAQANKIEPAIPKSSQEVARDGELPDKQLSQDTKMEKSKITALEDKQPSPATKSVIVTWTFVTIHSDAGNDSPVVAKVKQGDRLFVIGENSEWFNVKLDNGQQGWVKKMVCKAN